MLQIELICKRLRLGKFCTYEKPQNQTDQILVHVFEDVGRTNSMISYLHERILNSRFFVFLSGFSFTEHSRLTGQ